jgi:hypothetical protein
MSVTTAGPQEPLRCEQGEVAYEITSCRGFGSWCAP